MLSVRDSERSCTRPHLGKLLVTSIATTAMVLSITGTAHAPKLARSHSTRAVPVVATTAVQTAREDLELLARVVQAEARGEPSLGKVAVAAVVLNRVEDPRFPQSITEVARPSQFAVSRGAPTRECLEAAYRALRGEDPTGGALYFYNPRTSSCAWIRTREVTTEIGNHIFAK